MNATIRNAFLVLLVCSIGWAQGALAQLADTNVYAPPNYSTFQPPQVGGSYTDPVFGSSIQRVTNAPATQNLDRGGNLISITDEYSTMSPFNLDNSRILLIQQSYFALYDGNGAFLKALPMEINASSEPRWSRNDPNAFYYHAGNQLKKYDVSTDSSSVVHTFSEYSAIDGKGESDMSFDGDHMVFAGDNRYVFVYQLSTDSKSSAFDTAGRSFDSLYITPNNNVTITWLQAGTSRYNGIELFDGNMNFLRQVAHAGGHMDVTRDNGDEVLVWTNSNDAQPLAGCNNGIVKIRLSDATQTCLLSLDWSLAVHISGPDNSGYVFIETYAPSNPDPGSSAWVRYTNEILQIKLDGTEVRRLAHHRSRPLDSYNYMPRVSASHDGSKLVYNSNYDLQAILGYPADYADVYLMNLSDNTAPPNVPPAPPAAAPTITTSSLTGGTQNSSYNATLAASGGAAPYVWTLTTGSLPTGLALGSGGAISGTPNGTGTSNFTVQVADNSLQTASKALSITVSAQTSPSAPPSSTTTTRTEQNAAAISYSGTWYPNSLPGNSGGSAVLAMDPGSRATFTFTGTAVRWIGYRDEWSGIANVYIDGQLKAAVDMYASPAQYQTVLYSAAGLSANTHTLVVEATGTHGSASAGSWIWVDAFDVDNTTSSGGSIPPAARVEQDNAAAKYAGPWFTHSQSSLSGGNAIMAMDKNASAVFTFSGTGASWIGYKDAWSGMANVSVDGARAVRIDTYSPTDVAQAVIYSVKGLSPGTHTLTIDVLQRKNAASGGYWIWVDAFEVKP